MTEPAVSYEDGLFQAWVGELQGEMFFERKAQAVADKQRGQRGKWQELAELERVTGWRMAALLRAKGIELSAPEPNAELLAFVEIFAQMPHAETLAALRPILLAAIDKFEALLRQAPEADRQAVQFLVDHERALLRFVDLEQAGADSSVDTVRALIQSATT